jgi:hypothetical protein
MRIGVAHPAASPDMHHILLDLSRTTDTSKWKGILAAIGAVINAAAALQGRHMQGVHVAGARLSMRPAKALASVV